ncbi:MAG: sporulation membrane protein YtaF [Clostridia bacterium]|jgi:putative sporulation protein YtaF|nr:sporulation membrane protein YtaF [Clostridia bacterium]
MLISCFILATSVSIDALGIGITYGLRNTKITRCANIILFILSILMTSLSVFIGDTLSNFLPNFITNFIGSFFLIIMGIWVIYQALNKKNNKDSNVYVGEAKIYKFFIDFLGITIQIIRNPISSDLDSSKKIDWKEALYLGIALSIDSFCIGIFGSIIGYSSVLFPILVASFQLIFLTIGSFLGTKLSNISKIPENIWSIISGILLICIAISRFFI